MSSRSSADSPHDGGFEDLVAVKSPQLDSQHTPRSTSGVYFVQDGLSDSPMLRSTSIPSRSRTRLITPRNVSPPLPGAADVPNAIFDSVPDDGLPLIAVHEPPICDPEIDTPATPAPYNVVDAGNAQLNDFGHQLEVAAGRMQKSDDTLLPNAPDVALCGLSRFNPFRRACMYLVNASEFDIVIFVIIIANMVVLAIYQPGDQSTVYAQALVIADYVFTALFTVECLIRIIALGLVTERGTYLRDPWNVFTILVVGVSYLSLLPQLTINITALRTLIALRPLSSMRVIAGLRSMTNALLTSLPAILNVLLLLVFLFTVFGIIGVQLFANVLNYRCLDSAGNIDDISRVCSISGAGYNCSGGYSCQVTLGGPYDGFVSFDHLGWSFLQVFVTLTLEHWVYIMGWCMDAVGPWSSIYFILLVIIGSFFFLSLALAVIANRFSEVRARQLAERTALTQAQLALKWLKEKGHSFDQWLYAHALLKRTIDGIQRFSAFVVQNRFTPRLMALIVTVNIILMAIDRPGQSAQEIYVGNVWNIITSTAFALETVLTIAAIGPLPYFEVTWHAFDFLVALAGIIELGLGGSSFSSVFRGLRVLRALRLLKPWKSFRLLLDAVQASLSQTGYFFALLGIWMLIYAIIGMRLFGDAIPATQRPNFTNLWQSYLAVFQVVATDDWNIYMYAMARATSMWALMFYISLFISGQYILLNLFIAILLGGFEDQTEKDRQRRLQEQTKAMLTLQLYSVKPQADIKRQQQIELKRLQDLEMTAAKPAMPRELHDSKHKAFGLLRPKNPFRHAIVVIVSSHVFEGVVLFFVVLSCVFAAIQSPGNSELLIQIHSYMQYCVTAIFGLEALLRMIADGVLLHRGAYFRNPWNIMDFITLVICIVDCFLKVDLYIVNCLRAFRAIRLLSQVTAVKTALWSLFRSSLVMINITLMVLIVWFLFAVFGVQLFQKTLDQCSDASLLTATSCLNATANNTWSAAGDYSFDNVGLAMYTLFQVAITENWGSVMWATMDTRGVDIAPVFNARPAAALFILSFMLIGAFTMLNLFVGVIIDSFGEHQVELQHNGSLTLSQRAWLETTRLLMSLKERKFPVEPHNLLRAWCWKLVTWQYFEWISQAVIAVNTVCIMVSAHGSGGQSWSTTFEAVIQPVFCAAYSFEMIVMLLGRGPKYYFTNRWHVFDFITTITSILDVAIDDPTGSLVLRILRVTRVFKLAKVSPGLLLLLRTLLLSLRPLGGVSLMLFVFVFVYAVLGVALWGQVKLQTELSAESNFTNWLYAMLILLRMSTGEAWNDVMRECQVQPPLCTSGVDCGSVYAPVYFVSYMFLIKILMLNVVLAVIVEVLNTLARTARGAVNARAFEKFVTVWAMYDPDATGLVPYSKLEELMRTLGPPLGIMSKLPPVATARTMSSLWIAISPEGFVEFHHVLYHLCFRVVGAQLPARHLAHVQGALQRFMPDQSTVAVAEQYAARWVQFLYRLRHNRHQTPEKNPLQVAFGHKTLDAVRRQQHSSTMFRSAPVDAAHRHAAPVLPLSAWKESSVLSLRERGPAAAETARKFDEQELQVFRTPDQRARSMSRSFSLPAGERLYPQQDNDDEGSDGDDDENDSDGEEDKRV